MKKSIKQVIGKRMASIMMSTVLAFTGVGLLPRLSMSVHAAPAQSYDISSASVNETFNDDCTVEITGSTTSNTVQIEVASGKTVTVNLNNLSIDVSSFDNKCAFNISGAGNVIINLIGTNTLASGLYCAGLQKDSTGTLSISGNGSLTATGGRYGSGIGGHNYGHVSNITISGGTVTAVGGFGAAGIGGGWEGNCSNITISGGNVTATGGEGGAGIGGGNCGDGSYIEISGGTVTANGGTYGAGIGGGVALSVSAGNGTNISVSGGTVYAIGGYCGAGIGGGMTHGSGGTASEISISGSSVVSVSGGSDYTDPNIGHHNGSGSAIGTGGHNNAVLGDETTPDTSGLYTTGRVKYYPAGTTDFAALQPSSTTVGSLYAITVNTSGNGSASASASHAASGTDITLTATPGNGYIFTEWQVSPNTVTITNNSFTMLDQPVTVTAVFEAVSQNPTSPTTPSVPSVPTDTSILDPEPPVNYMQEVEDEINAAIRQGGPQTVIIKGYDTLSYDVLKLLSEHEQITLISEFTYNDVQFKLTIPGGSVKLNPDIRWYGPKCLYPMFYSYSTDTYPEVNTYIAMFK